MVRARNKSIGALTAAARASVEQSPSVMQQMPTPQIAAMPASSFSH
jgi:hypothetical protein